MFLKFSQVPLSFRKGLIMVHGTAEDLKLLLQCGKVETIKQSHTQKGQKNPIDRYTAEPVYA
jgi:hypothetical protein